ncbi:MAG TPA: hypothetical protein VH084_08430 [Mycobacterium sp.]|nr:hypothetical protein [Mycobacterium sp.]
MTAPGEWIHIAGHAWEFYGTGAHYTLHHESDRWVARRFSLSDEGDATKDVEESAPTIEEAKQIVHRWESQE